MLAFTQAQALRTMHENITVTDMKSLQPIFEAISLGDRSGRPAGVSPGRVSLVRYMRWNDPFVVS